jgi:hypothetical protein
MTTFTQTQGTHSSALITMGALASDTYAGIIRAIDLGSAIPLDVTIES